VWWLTPAILSTWEAEIGVLWFEARSWLRIKPCLKNKLGMVVHICNPSYSGGRGRRIGLGKNARSCQKQAKAAKRSSSGRMLA
jgi:hypothetical protein